MTEASTAYLAPSVLTTDGGEARLQLETALGATPQGLVAHPTFFSGFVARPVIAAAGVLTVADVAATTYLDLGALMTAKRDPVVTASGDRLRFESFSGCNGVYSRLDLLPDGIDSGTVEFGTTNVDVNQPLRTALAGMPRHELLHLAVGPESLTVSTLEETIEEAKVELPQRWVRGFAEVPQIASTMSLVAEVGGPQAMTFLAGLSSSAPGPTVQVAAAGSGLRVVAGARGARLAGTARLTSLKRIMRHIRSLRVYAHPSGASGWVAELDGARVTLLLSPAAFRGFSGEGALLSSFSAASAGDDAARLLEHLAWEPVIDPAWLELATGLPAERVTAGLAELAASGRVGYDLAEQSWFHRELPYAADAATRDNPRLVKARALVASGTVSQEEDRWVVGEDGRRHWVTLGPGAGTGECTCRFFARYGTSRGPCSHLLAASLAAGAQPSDRGREAE